MWTSVWRKTLAQSDLIKIDCFGSKIACDVSSDRRIVHEAAALIFHGRDVSFWDMPKRKYVGQPWVLWNQEPPSQSPIQVYKQGSNLFDLELGYRQTADIFAPYGFFSQKRAEASDENREKLEKRFIKQNGAVWLVSDCWTESRRENYVQELQRYFPVDVYGACGNRICPMSASDSCMNTLSQKYMFYLAFENSICPDYVTEKLYRTLQYPIIPVTMTGSRGQFLDSLHAFVDASNLDPLSLALKLKKISQNITQYATYFVWKKKYTAHNQVNPLCHICDKFRKQLNGAMNYKARNRTYLTDRMNHRACKTWNSNTQKFESIGL
ncbi:alpha-(1,3)-fucosyltransferase C-like isoform X2 [Varroa jacobsoni]|nr:alpha-(1,3)-fucosyltransferase C-like isoform X2 [Varroa destructor]XP_022697082.1 alpha-(1,3)-fucosyltransferase C-like isoform X2 [Varroa jacobsoni]XP_022697083.1 alpha-(1,3)-fucosyltransferase C-like isoform X2 [Varroa jacobsoni]